jgi:DNA-binding NtrC family response regulator
MSGARSFASVMTRLLVVDDDPSIREALTRALSEEVELHVAASAEGALSGFAALAPDVVLSDVRMPGMDGLALLKLLRERAPSVDIVMMSAFDDMPTVVAAMREGACDFLVKPLDLHDVRRVIARVLDDRRIRERARVSRQDDAAPYRLDSLVGRDPAMLATYKRVGQAAAVRSNVLIRGETGTGKELIARAVHYNSEERDEPFVALNCTALPQTLGAARSSLTRSVIPARSFRRSCCACSRSGNIIPSGQNAPNARRRE